LFTEFKYTTNPEIGFEQKIDFGGQLVKLLNMDGEDCNLKPPVKRAMIPV
jgi:hypothetical protein